jgi:hypothetical protein
MSKAASNPQGYTVPEGVLGLKGPVEKPAPGTLPLRGDLAHMALAATHLAAHYVIPDARQVGPAGTALRVAPGEEAETHQWLAPDTPVELLDIAGAWAWVCLGPQGPSGYCPADELAAASG